MVNKDKYSSGQPELNFSAKPHKHINQRNTARQHWHKYQATGIPATQDEQAHAIIKARGPLTARMVNRYLKTEYNTHIDQSTCSRAINTLLNLQPSPIKIFRRDVCPITGVRVQWYVVADYKEKESANG